MPFSVIVVLSVPAVLYILGWGGNSTNAVRCFPQGGSEPDINSVPGSIVFDCPDAAGVSTFTSPVVSYPPSSSSSSSSSTGSQVPTTDLFIALGQSNNQGEGCCANPLIDFAYPNMYQYVIGDTYSNAANYSRAVLNALAGTLQPAAEPMYDGGDNHYNNIGSSIALSRFYINGTQSTNPTVSIQTAVSGTSVEQWLPGPGSPNLLARSLQASASANALITGVRVVRAFTFVQGEGNAEGNSAGPDFQTKVWIITNYSRNSTQGATMETPFLYGSMLPEWVTTGGYSDAIVIQNVLRGLPQLIPYTAYVNMLLGYVDCNESIHYSARGQRLMAYLFWLAYFRALANSNPSLVPNHPTGLTITLTGSNLVFSWTAPSSAITNYVIVSAPYVNLSNPGGSCEDGTFSPPTFLSTSSVSTTFTLPATFVTTPYFQFDVCAANGVQISAGNASSWIIVQQQIPPNTNYSTVNNPASFTPNPVVWYSANTLSRSLMNQAVSTWPDQSGNGHDLTSAGSSPPVLQSIASYPEPWLLFSAVTQYMTTANAFPVNSDYSIFIVINQLGAQCVGICILVGASDQSHAFYLQNGVLSVVHNGGQLTGNSNTVPISTPTVLAFVYTKSTTSGVYYIDGAQAGTATGAAINAGSSLALSQWNGAQNGFIGRDYEMMTFAVAATGTLLSQVQTYLENKYN